MRSCRWTFRLWTAGCLAGLGAAASSPVGAQGLPPVVPASRVLIRFAGGQFSLLERKDVRKVLHPSDELPTVQSPLGGFWYELRAADGNVRYRRIMEDPVRLVFEGPEDPSAPVPAPPSRKEAIPAERVFSLIIPAPEQGDQLVLFSSPLRPGAQGEPASEVARLDLFPVIIP